MRHVLRVVCAFFLICGARGQEANKKPVASTPPPVTPATQLAAPLPPPPPTPPVPLDAYPLSQERRAQVRELQYQFDQLQIQIEQLKQQQIALNDLISTIATDFAKIEKLNPAEYNLDPKNLKLVRLKTAAQSTTPPPAPTPAPGAQPGESFITKPIPKANPSAPVSQGAVRDSKGPQ